MKSKTRKSRTKTVNVPKLKFFWSKRKSESKFQAPSINSTEILINGKLFTCVVLSIISAFVDIVFFSGLSKSGYPFFGFLVPAAIILSLMSVGFSLAKFFFAMQITLMNELQNQLYSQGYGWAKSFNKAKLIYNVIHKFLISVSVVTSLSLSVITIGNGVRNMELNIRNMTTDANQLITMNGSYNEGVKDKRTAAKSNITGSINARDTAKAEVDRYYDRLVKYQDDWNKLPEDDKEGKDKIIAKIVNEIPGATRKNALYFTKADLQKSIQKTASANETTNSDKLYEDAINFDAEQIDLTIKSLEEKGYKNPDGTPLKFLTEDGKAINVQTAISRLQGSIALWQSDTGDAGASSKVFTLIATYLKASEEAGGMGKSEWMMMTLIFIFGVIQEIIIAKLTPRPIITRKLISQFSEYIHWGEFDVNLFLLKVYNTYRDTDVLSSEVFEYKAEKCIRLRNDSIEKVIARYTEKDDEENKETVVNINNVEPIHRRIPIEENATYSENVTNKINEIEEILK